MANNKKFYEAPSLLQKLFKSEVELLPSVTELFELELAYLEYYSINENGFLNRTAYFKSRNNQYSKHYLMYNTFLNTSNKDRSSATKNYFENGKFSTGYATHGLYPVENLPFSK